MLYAAGDFLVHTDPIERSGVIVLLSGGDTERMDEAARLMHERYAEELLLTDTARRMPDGMLETQYIRLELVSRGVSPAQIQITDQVVSSTRDEGRAVRAYLQLHQVSGCIIVTDPYHTRRTRMIFRDAFAGTGIDVRVIPSNGHWYRAETWFLSLRGWQTTISEYMKLGYYVLRKEIL